MARVARRAAWIFAPLLMAVLGNAAGQERKPQKSGDEPAGKLPALLTAEPVNENDPKDDALRKVLKARYNAALAEVKSFYEFKEMARNTAVTNLPTDDDLYGPWRRFLNAKLELSNTPDEKVAVLTEYLEFTKAVERDKQVRFDAGTTRIGMVHRARYERIDAEVRLLRAKQENGGGAGK